MKKKLSFKLFIIIINAVVYVQASDPGTNDTDFQYFNNVPTILLNKLYNNGQRECIVYNEDKGAEGKDVGIPNILPINAERLELATLLPELYSGDSIWRLYIRP